MTVESNNTSPRPADPAAPEGSKAERAKLGSPEWRTAQDRDFTWYNERMFKEQINAWNPLLDFFRSELDQSAKTVIEIGCGPTGGLLKFIRARRLIGVEPLANRFLEKGFEEIVRGEILYLDTVGEHIPLVNGFADTVCCMHSLGHIQEPRLVLDEIDRLLTVGGQLWIMDILRAAEQVTIDHPFALSGDDILDWLTSRGYRPVRTDFDRRYQENDFDLPLFYGIFEKTRTGKPMAAMVDFSQGTFDEQLAGGWYQLETETRPSRWVSDRFSLHLELAGESRVQSLLVEGYAQVSALAESRLALEFTVADQVVGGRTLTEDGLFTLRLPLPADLAPGRLRVMGDSSGFFVPDQVRGNGDLRELAYVVFRIGFVPTISE